VPKTYEKSMKRYRSKPPLKSSRLRSDDGWDDYNLMEKNITVYETEANWETIGLLGPDGQPIEALVGGMEPIGFLHDFIASEEDE
jgi:hypothetical protein